jgi:DNA adenine methylase
VLRGRELCLAPNNGDSQGAATAPRNQPFLRWAGGKRQILQLLLAELPRNIAKLNYHEPFLGAGSLFFALDPAHAFLSDANSALIQTFAWVRDAPEAVHRELRRHARLHCDGYYYEIRERYNASGPCAAQAARFIYLNKACFNGIFRVNRKGHFNVPVGDKKSIAMPTTAGMKSISLKLKQASLSSDGYMTTISKVNKGDFVYLDPPYPPLNGTAYFNHYTTPRFGTLEHEGLAKAFRSLDNLGAQVLLSNADTPEVRQWYRGYRLKTTEAIRYVTCKKIRHRVNELIIKNF